MLFGFGGILSTHIEGLGCFRHLALAFDNMCYNTCCTVALEFLKLTTALMCCKFISQYWFSVLLVADDKKTMAMATLMDSKDNQY